MIFFCYFDQLFKFREIKTNISHSYYFQSTIIFNRNSSLKSFFF